MLVSLASIAVNYGVAFAMVRYGHLGHAGLALSTSAVALFAFLVLFAVLRKKIGGVHGRALASQFGKIAAASAAMAAVIALSTHGMSAWLGVSKLAHLADVAISIPLGLAVYYVACRALGIAEIDSVIRAFIGPVERRVRRLL
jgi:putative peptidoglycan lipid II flippase